MKIKLIESAHTVDKYIDDIEKNVIPVFEDFGFYFNTGFPKYKNRFAVVFNGTYSDGLVTIPCRLEINTTNADIDYYNREREAGDFVANAFMRLYFLDNVFELGVVDLSDEESIGLMVGTNQDEFLELIHNKKGS
jgi:hypothetical protein